MRMNNTTTSRRNLIKQLTTIPMYNIGVFIQPLLIYAIDQYFITIKMLLDTEKNIKATFYAFVESFFIAAAIIIHLFMPSCASIWSVADASIKMIRHHNTLKSHIQIIRNVFHSRSFCTVAALGSMQMCLINIAHDIHHVYIESHSLTDIKQMAGRIRSGAEHIYIILNSVGHGNNEHRFEQVLTKALCDERLFSEKCSSFNTILQKFCIDHRLSLADAYRPNGSDISDFINLVKQKFPYVEYDYFSRELRFNAYHKYAREFAAAESKLFNDAADDHPSLVALFQKEFPNTIIHAYISPVETGSAYVQRYLEQHPEKYHPFSEIISIAAHLRELLGSPKRSKKSDGDNVVNPNYYLRKVGFQYERRNKNKSHPNYNLCSLEPYCGKNPKSDFAA